MRPARQLLPRRLVVFVTVLLVLGLSGLGLLLFRWWGERGALPSGRLYVHGDFANAGTLLVMNRAADDPACYDLEGAEGRLCRGQRRRVWIEDALVDVSVGARGVPRISLAGLRGRDGDWLGSLADRNRDHPRVPIRAYGVPALAGRIAACDERLSPKGTLSLPPFDPPKGTLSLPPFDPPKGTLSLPPFDPPKGTLCLDVHDRLGRVAVLRGPSAPLPEGEGSRKGSRTASLAAGQRHVFQEGDVLWLGLVAFEVSLESDGDEPAVVLHRVDRLRARRGQARTAADRGGDRRWLGRLWHVEAPDPAEGETPQRFELHSMRERYTTYNLSRQRTNFEGEDVVQRLIDGGWLCLNPAANDGQGELVWRPLELPGCAGRDEDVDPARISVTHSAMQDYQRARYGDLAFLANSLVDNANAALAEEAYLEDATALPFAFDWDLAYRSREARVPQPMPGRLWGVRFGVTRQIRRSAILRRGLLPDVLPRSSTARHVVQVLDAGDDLVSGFYLPQASGSICLGEHEDSAAPYRPTSGAHHPLGSVAFGDDPLAGTWSADPATPCQGCRLHLAASGDGTEGVLAITAEGACDGSLSPLPLGEGPGVRVLAHEDETALGAYRLRYVDRVRPWLASTDPGSRRRHFADEFYLRGALRPLIGDGAALSGVEAALVEYLDDSGQVGTELDAFELTIDGDLQLTAAAIVDTLAHPLISPRDPEPHRVSVTAAVLDTRRGELLAAVNYSTQGSDYRRRSTWTDPSAWELGSGQADVLENAVLLRRQAIGSTMKVTGSYALLNNRALETGGDLAKTRHTVFEAGDRGELRIEGRRGRPSRRRCSTGPHYLPSSARGFTSGTFVRRFAESCNNFFVLTGFRHAGNVPAELGRANGQPPGHGELHMDVRDGRAVLVQPEAQELVDRIRDGLRTDFAAGAGVPKSLFGILYSLGFQPQPDADPRRGFTPASMRFDHRGGDVTVPLVHDWFAPTNGVPSPAFEPGRDFAYPAVPSPARMDHATVRGEAITEHYGDEERKVKRHGDDGRADVQYSMLMIGQSSVESSALGLASLYAPAARGDGRAVSPCLFRANCGKGRAGARVIEDAEAGMLNAALREVVDNGTAAGGLRRVGLRDFAARGWGGKTGTYQVERHDPTYLSRDVWHQLRAWACGVRGVRRPKGDTARGFAFGAARGARACEDFDTPFNASGVHHYQFGAAPTRLDRMAQEMSRNTRKRIEIYHSFVAVAPPPRDDWPETENPAEGIVVAVLVDRETEDEKSIAIQIGAEIAAAVERWASLAR